MHPNIRSCPMLSFFTLFDPNLSYRSTLAYRWPCICALLYSIIVTNFPPRPSLSIPSQSSRFLLIPLCPVSFSPFPSLSIPSLPFRSLPVLYPPSPPLLILLFNYPFSNPCWKYLLRYTIFLLPIIPRNHLSDHSLVQRKEKGQQWNQPTQITYSKVETILNELLTNVEIVCRRLPVK